MAKYDDEDMWVSVIEQQKCDLSVVVPVLQLAQGEDGGVCGVGVGGDWQQPNYDDDDVRVSVNVTPVAGTTSATSHSPTCPRHRTWAAAIQHPYPYPPPPHPALPPLSSWE